MNDGALYGHSIVFTATSTLQGCRDNSPRSAADRPMTRIRFQADADLRQTIVRVLWVSSIDTSIEFGVTGFIERRTVVFSGHRQPLQLNEEV
jgi:hypothetical protein